MTAFRMDAPSTPWDAAWLLINSSATRFARFDGIENPTPILPAVSEELDAVAIATLMPMSSPLVFNNAPPELPGLIDASVWMTGREIKLSRLLFGLSNSGVLFQKLNVSSSSPCSSGTLGAE